MILYLETEQFGKLPVRIAYSAMKHYQLETGKSLMSQMENGMTDMMAGDLEYLLFHGLKKGHKLEGKEFNLTMEDMEDILDEALFDFIKMIPKFFPQDEQGPQNAPKSKKSGQKK